MDGPEIFVKKSKPPENSAHRRDEKRGFHQSTAETQQLLLVEPMVNGQQPQLFVQFLRPLVIK